MKRIILLFSLLGIVFACNTEEKATIMVESVSLDKPSLELFVGDSETLTATVSPADATNKKVSWTSSDPSVATVVEGVVSGIKPGSATVIVSTEEGGKTAFCSVKVKSNLAPSVTGAAANISAISAVLNGKANAEAIDSKEFTVGVQYSLSEEFPESSIIQVEADNADKDFNYSVGITGLTPETKYFYRSYVCTDTKLFFGETLDFTTKNLSSMLGTPEVSQITAVSAKLIGRLDLTDVQYEDLSVGFHYGNTEGYLYGDLASTYSNGEFFANLTALTPSTEWFFQAYAIIDGIEYKGEVLHFNTKDIFSMFETMEAESIEAERATLKAKLDLTDVSYQNLSYGFYYGTRENSLNTWVRGNNIDEGTYSYTLSGLTSKTQYWYRSYLSIDGQSFNGEVKTFTTETINVQSISLDRTSYTFNTIGNTLYLYASILPSNATDRSVSWSSSNPNVASVDDNGRVKALANGQAIISVTANSNGMTASCEITVAQSVTGLSLNKNTLRLQVDESEKLIATLTPNNAANPSLSWTSNNTGVATVTDDGLVTARGQGSAIITVRANDGSGYSASCSVTVYKAVTSITLDPEEITLFSGQSQTISASVYPTDASNTGVSWGSSNTSIATVDSYGKVTGVSGGNATITATAKDGSGISATCRVIVKQGVASITLDKTSMTLGMDESYKLIATISPDNAENKELSWTSSNTSVATVNSEGVVTPVAPGQTTIKATTVDGSGKSASCSVTVKRFVSAITLSLEAMDVFVGRTKTLTATVTPSDATSTSVTWSSSNSSIAKVDSYGRVTGVAVGNAVITVKANDGSNVSASCTVSVKQAVTSVKLDKTSLSLYTGQQYTFTPTVNPSNASDKSLVWTTTNSNVATVDDNGTVTAIGNGSATIKATAHDGSGYSASCSVTVQTLVSSIVLEQSEITLYAGKSCYLYWNVLPATASNISMSLSSSNTSVVTVSDSQITARAAGEAIITVKAQDGSNVQATCHVTVLPAIQVSFNWASSEMIVGEEMDLEMSLSPIERPVVWSSSLPRVVTVSETGHLQALATGRAIIKASVADESSYYAECCIVVVDPSSEVNSDKVVDLGLSVLWAKNNNISTKETVNGGYYSWGDYAPKSTYSAGYYKWYKNGSSSNILKYNTSDKLEELENTDDATYVMSGGTLRIPTRDEVQELIDDAKWSIETVNDVKGYRVSGKGQEYGSNSIFIPFCGWKTSSSVSNNGSRGYYMTRNRSTSDVSKCLYLCIYETGRTIYSSGNREYGYTIRPVANSYENNCIVHIGEPFDLYAEYFSNGEQIIWKSMDESVVSVSEDGIAMAKVLGKAFVIARHKDTGKTLILNIITRKPFRGGGGSNEEIGEGDEL